MSRGAFHVQPSLKPEILQAIAAGPLVGDQLCTRLQVACRVGGKFNPRVAIALRELEREGLIAVERPARTGRTGWVDFKISAKDGNGQST